MSDVSKFEHRVNVIVGCRSFCFFKILRDSFSFASLGYRISDGVSGGGVVV